MLNTVSGGLNPYALKTGRGNYTLKPLKGSQLKVGREGKANYSFRNTGSSTGEERENGECGCCITDYGAALSLHLTSFFSRFLAEEDLCQ